MHKIRIWEETIVEIILCEFMPAGSALRQLEVYEYE